MNNQEILKELSLKLATGELRKGDILPLLESAQPSLVSEKYTFFKEDGHISISKILYILGSAVALLGIVFLVGQIWDDIGVAGHIMVTFGLGVLCAGVGSWLLTIKPEHDIGLVMHVLGGLLIPGGAMVVLNELGGISPGIWLVTITFSTIFLFYLLLALYHKHAILTVYTFFNGTISIYLLTVAMLDSTGYVFQDIYAYLTMAVGISYLLFAISFVGTWNKRISGLLNFFGSGAFLGAAFSQVFDSVVWQLIFFALAVGALALAVHIRSRSVLVVGTLFLIGHFSFITGKYFADSIGWPVSLVILGFLFIGLGYVSLNLNKKYIPTS